MPWHKLEWRIDNNNIQLRLFIKSGKIAVISYFLLFQIRRLEDLHLVMPWFRTKKTRETGNQERKNRGSYIFFRVINQSEFGNQSQLEKNCENRIIADSSKH